MSVDNVINQMNQFTHTAGVVQGAAEAMVPAVYAVDNAAHQVAGVFTGADNYQPSTYTQSMGLPPAGPQVGLVGSLLSGGITGAVMHRSVADALRSFKDGIGSGLKNTTLSGLKSGLIGAGVMGAVSGVRNFAAASRGEITQAEATGNVAADTVGGILAGTGAGFSAGAAHMLLSKMLPGGGLITTIGAVVAGAAGATGANLLYQNSQLRNGIASGVRDAVGGTASTQAYSPAPQAYYGY